MAEEAAKILIVEDDADIAGIERDYLEIAGYEVTVVDNGEDGLQEGLSGDYSLVLLDVMLPGMSGFDVCKQLRQKINIPILMVTARHDDIDQIRGLGLGADDYIGKPFSPPVLVAKVKAQIDRYNRLVNMTTAGEEDSQNDVIETETITLQRKTHRVFVRGKEVSLTNKEFQLLEFLMLNKDVVFSRDDLYNHVWGLDSLGDSATVAVHINRLREEIEEVPAKPEHLMTVWGVGYKFVP